MQTTNRYLNEKEVSQITGFAVGSLRNDRLYRKGIPFIKVGRSVRYSLSDVVKYMEMGKVMTSDWESQ